MSCLDTRDPFRALDTVALGQCAQPNHVEFIENAWGKVVYASLARVDDNGAAGVASNQIAIIDRSAPAGQRKVVGSFFSQGREAHGLWTNPENTLLYVAREQDELPNTANGGQTVCSAFDTTAPLRPSLHSADPTRGLGSAFGQAAQQEEHQFCLCPSWHQEPIRMKTSRRSLVLGAATATTRAAALAQEPAGDVRGHHSSDSLSTPTTGMPPQMGLVMDAMSRAGVTGDPDLEFLAMMIPHHQGVVDMAQRVLEHGRDPLTRQLAEGIIASQSAEIASMQARLRALEKGQTPNTDGFPALTGTRG